MQNTSNISPLVAAVGLNTDNILSQLKEGQLTFAKNAMVENFDGQSVTYQNELSNVLCTDFGDGWIVIGQRNIVEQNKTIFILTKLTGESSIVERVNTTCETTVLISSTCLNFSVNYPIRKIEVKTTNCSTQLYWTDNNNPPRWMDLDNLPFLEIPNPENENRPIVTETVDCNKLLIFPHFSVPLIDPVRVETGGSLVTGAYQFAIQYANAEGEGYTSFYSVTNPIGIYDDRVTNDFNLPTTQSINVNVTDIDITGLFDYFNLVVLETVNAITTPKLVGTYAITGSTFNVTYTGNTKTDIEIPIEEILNVFPYYDTAKDLAVSDNTVQWGGLSLKDTTIYQSIWSQVRTQWESYTLPVNQFESYNNPINTGEFRGYMRDEVYALEGAFYLKNGRITKFFHIPSRPPLPVDLEIINNQDAQNTLQNPCEPVIPKPRWQVYNTANKIDFTDEYKAAEDISCYKGSYEYGEFAYWESTVKYPNNPDIWGSLANTPIRHHKFPDCLVSPIHDNGNGSLDYEHRIFPLGIRIVINSLYAAIDTSSLTQEEKDNIQGFIIARSSRTDNNRSVVAKGLLFNAGKYTREGQQYYYPNYPFNDVGPDPFILSSEPVDHSGLNTGLRLRGFDSDDSKRRFTFHSPDTHFGRPFGIDTGYLKLETIEQGTTRSHFVQVKNNANYKFLTQDAVRVAFALGMSSIATFEVRAGFPSGITLAPGINMTNVVPATMSALELLKNVTPAANYGWNFNSVANYHTSVPVPNNGNKIRSIDTGRYLASGQPSVDGDIINNFNRESSVYLRTVDTLPFTHEVGGSVDNSRYLSSDYGCSTNPSDIQNRDVSSYYSAIKRLFPDQYGRMYSYESVGTGYYLNIENRPDKIPAVFGGDTFINRFGLKRKLPFFIDNTVGRAEQTDINLDDLGNIGYPNFFYSTAPRDLNFDLGDLDTEVNAIISPAFWNIILNFISGGIRPIASALIILSRVISVYVNSIGVPNVNLDCSALKTLNEIGRAYLFAYGIPYFFVESDVNVDFRQAINDKAGDFYPNVGEGIPDDWMQESNVSIVNDNSYTYNKSYSKQNREMFIDHLKETFDPSKLCVTQFPNRIIYSQRSTVEETKNNWLIYRPISRFDLPKNYGTLTAIDGLEDRKLLVRFENKSLLYNVYQTSDTSTGTLYMGNPNFFSQPPLDFAETDTGYNGSQHKFLLKTEYGHVTVDSERGQVFLYRGNKLDDISSKGMEKWFAENLPFQIRKYFPNVPIDNAFKDIGLTGVYDTLYKRIIITKRDYVPLVSGILYDNDTGSFSLLGETISINDSQYFCNISWTISYSMMTQSWISFHSYIPNYYIQHTGYFESNNGSKTYSHNDTSSFLNFYGQIEDYTLEYPKFNNPNDEIVSSISDNTTILQYQTRDVYTEIENGVYFNQVIIYNNQQCSGLLEPVFKPINDRRTYFDYPKFKPASKEVLVTKKDGMFRLNTFWDIVSDKSKPFYSRPCNIPSVDKIFNVNLDYTIRSHNKGRIRGKECRIRLTYNKSSNYKLVSKFMLVQTQTSFI